MGFIPVMRGYKLHRAADHLEKWCLGTLDLQPLLDVSAKLGGRFHFKWVLIV